MLAKINKLFSGIPATVLSGLFLIASFVLPRVGVQAPVDPAWFTIIVCGIPLLYLSVWRIIHNPGISKISSALLITIAMVAAICIGDLFAAGEVAFIMQLGAILEDMITDRAKKGLHKLLKLSPTQGRRIRNGKEEMIPADQIAVGDVLRVAPGETIPVDGRVLSGETAIDQSIMTGESLPADKKQGDSVFCGTLNCFGSVDIEATHVGKDSSLQKLIQMVQQAEEQKAPMARIADLAATWLVPLVVVIAVATGLITKDIVRAVTIMVVFCPCALVLSTPTAIMAAIGQATKKGVIIKSGEALENMGKVNTIAFDKTGTLTEGKLQVSDMICLDKEISQQELLRLAASAERKSEHPLGKAIAAGGAKLPLAEAEEFHMYAGKGIRARVEGQELLCGTESFLSQYGVTVPKDSRLDTLREQGKAAVLIARSGVCIGVIAMSDTLRPEAKSMVSSLQNLGTDAVLLTGDSQKTAAYFANLAGIRQIRAQLLPQEKVESIAALQNQGMQVCMIGDGVNDAPALKTANVGVAMGTMGSDIAVEAADITLIGDDLSKLSYLKRLSNATVNTIKLSICLSMTINFIAVGLSMAGILNPTTGALVHNVGSCLVVLIAALLYDRKFD